MSKDATQITKILNRGAFGRLVDTANALYDAGYWTCDRDVDEKKLWEDLRDALGREPGSSPKPIDRE